MLIVLLQKNLYNCLLVNCLLCVQAAVEEGIVVGGGCTLLRLASKVDAIKETLENDEQKV
jgi:chaperonin GroEL